MLLAAGLPEPDVVEKKVMGGRLAEPLAPELLGNCRGFVSLTGGFRKKYKGPIPAEKGSQGW